MADLPIAFQRYLRWEADISIFSWEIFSKLDIWWKHISFSRWGSGRPGWRCSLSLYNWLCLWKGGFLSLETFIVILKYIPFPEHSGSCHCIQILPGCWSLGAVSWVLGTQEACATCALHKATGPRDEEAEIQPVLCSTSRPGAWGTRLPRGCAFPNLYPSIQVFTSSILVRHRSRGAPRLIHCHQPSGSNHHFSLKVQQ